MPENVHLFKEALFEKIFTHAHGGIAIISLEGRWVKVNKSITDFLGYTENELNAISVLDITHRDDVNNDLDHMNQLIDGEIDNYQIEKRYFHKNGHVIWALLSVSMVCDELKRPLYFISQIADINERKVASWQLNLLMNVAKEQNKKLLDFAHIATHDIRTHVGNLGSIIGFIEDDFEHIHENENFKMLKESLLNLEETLEHLNEIRKNKLNDNKELKALSLDAYVTHAIYNINAIAKKHHCQVLNHTNKEHQVYAIEPYLDSIILNFLTNAIKYRSVNRLPVIIITSEIVEEFVVLRIEDNGLGIDLENHGHKLFTLNGTFHEHMDSRGIGLFITKNHVESIGGRIEVESQVDEGTCFSVYFKKA